MASLEKSREREYFDRVADIFDTHLNVYAKFVGILRLKRRLDFFSQECRFTRGLKVLELGCGTGEYTRGLLKENLNLFCVDISYNMIKKAEEKNRVACNLYFVISDAVQLPFKNGVFDVVVGNSVLHHILDINEAVYQINRVLKKGGRFAFSEPNMLNPQIFLQKNIGILRRLCGDTPYERAFFRWQIKEIFGRARFKNVKVKPFDFLHPLCPDILAERVNRMGSNVLEKIGLIKEIAGSLLISGEK